MVPPLLEKYLDLICEAPQNDNISSEFEKFAKAVMHVDTN